MSVELAFAMPVFLMLLVGALEIANYMFVSGAMENAVMHASRFGVTGEAKPGHSREEVIRDIIAKQSFGQLRDDRVEIKTTVYEQFSDVETPEPYVDENGNESWDEGESFTDVNGNGQWDPDVGSAGLGNGGDIVVYRIIYNMHSLTGLYDWATSFGTVEAVVAVRNEPY